MAKQAIVEGQVVRIGDSVGFKCDIEQGGKIIDIKTDWNNRKVLVLENEYGFDGGYIGGDTVTEQLASDCWL